MADRKKKDKDVGVRSTYDAETPDDFGNSTFDAAATPSEIRQLVEEAGGFLARGEEAEPLEDGGGIGLENIPSEARTGMVAAPFPAQPLGAVTVETIESDAETTGLVQRLHGTVQVRPRRDGGLTVDRLEPNARDEPTEPRAIPSPHDAGVEFDNDGLPSGLELRTSAPIEPPDAWHTGMTGVNGPPPLGDFNDRHLVMRGGRTAALGAPSRRASSASAVHEPYDEGVQDLPMTQESWLRAHMLPVVGLALVLLVVLIFVVVGGSAQKEIEISAEPLVIPAKTEPPRRTLPLPRKDKADPAVPDPGQPELVSPTPLHRIHRPSEVEVERPKPRKRSEKKSGPPCAKKFRQKSGDTVEVCCDRAAHRLFTPGSDGFFKAFDACAESPETWKP